MATKKAWIGNRPQAYDNADTYPDNGDPIEGGRFEEQILVQTAPTKEDHVLRKRDRPAVSSVWGDIEVADITNPEELKEYSGDDFGLAFVYEAVEDQVDKIALYKFDSNTDIPEFGAYRFQNTAGTGTWIAMPLQYVVGNSNHDGNIYPSVDDTYYLGVAALKRWAGGYFNELKVDKVPADDNDAVNKLYADAIIGGGGTTLKLLSVANIADPSAEMSGQSGTAGQLLIAYQAAAGVNTITVYAFDNSVSTTDDAPYIVSGTGGKWIAVGGRYCQQAMTIKQALTLIAGLTGTTATFSGAVSVASLSSSGSVSGTSASISGTATVGAVSASGNVGGATLSSSGAATVGGHANIAQPYVKAYQNSGQTIADNTTTTLTGWTEVTDTNAAFNPTTGLFTVPANMGGRYLITGKVWFAYDATGTRALDVTVNGTPSTRTAGYDNTTVQHDMAITITRVLNLNAGDTLGLCVYQNSGGPLDTKAILEGDKAWVEIVKVA